MLVSTKNKNCLRFYVRRPNLADSTAYLFHYLTFCVSGKRSHFLNVDQE